MSVAGLTLAMTFRNFFNVFNSLKISRKVSNIYTVVVDDFEYEMKINEDRTLDEVADIIATVSDQQDGTTMGGDEYLKRIESGNKPDKDTGVAKQDISPSVEQTEEITIKTLKTCDYDDERIKKKTVDKNVNILRRKQQSGETNGGTSPFFSQSRPGRSRPSSRGYVELIRPPNANRDIFPDTSNIQHRKQRPRGGMIVGEGDLFCDRTADGSDPASPFGRFDPFYPGKNKRMSGPDPDHLRKSGNSDNSFE